MPDFVSVLPTDHDHLIGKLVARCVLCRLPAYVGPYKPDKQSSNNVVFSVFCSRCGIYSCTQSMTMTSKWSDLNPTQVANISGYIRENQGFLIEEEDDVDFLRQLSTPAVAEKAHKLLAAIARCQPIPGTCLEIRCHLIDNQLAHFLKITESRFQEDTTADKAALEMFPFLGFAWAQNEQELRFLLMDYLIKGVGFIEMMSSTDSGPKIRFKISAKGWEHLQAAGVSDSSTGFVAMWFDDSMNVAWENAFYPAIRDAGYAPLRIDKREHNNKIDDEIIASIRGARFIVADFTGGRGGVYFEAGFAGGLTKPVIWTVRQDWLQHLHFDTRQFNHIAWADDHLAQLKDALQLRIEATIGRGPIKTAA